MVFPNIETSQVHWSGRSVYHRQPLDPESCLEAFYYQALVILINLIYIFKLFSTGSTGPVTNRLEVILAMKRKYHWAWTKPNTLNLIYLEQTLKAHMLRRVRQILKLSEASWGRDGSGGGVGESCTVLKQQPWFSAHCLYAELRAACGLVFWFFTTSVNLGEITRFFYTLATNSSCRKRCMGHAQHVCRPPDCHFWPPVRFFWFVLPHVCFCGCRFCVFLWFMFYNISIL